MWMLLAGMVAAAGMTAAEIGAPAPEWKVDQVLRGDFPKFSAVKGKMPVVIHFWTTNCKPCDEVQSQLNELARKYAGKIQFVGIGSDDPATLRKYPKLKDFEFPVAADDMVKSADLFLREADRLPTDVVIGQDGKVLWIGPSAALAGVLEEITRGEYDLKEAMELDLFNREMTAAVKRNDHAASLKLMEARLKKYPDDTALIAARCNLLARQMASPEKARVEIEAAIARLPKDFKLRETQLNLLRFSGVTGKPVLDAYRAIARDYADRPMLLVQLSEALMRQPVGQYQLLVVYELARAAAGAGKFASPREEGRAYAALARSYYYAGLVDRAVAEEKKAYALLKGTPDEKRAAIDLMYYHDAQQAAAEILRREKK